MKSPVEYGKVTEWDLSVFEKGSSSEKFFDSLLSGMAESAFEPVKVLSGVEVERSPVSSFFLSFHTEEELKAHYYGKL